MLQSDWTAKFLQWYKSGRSDVTQPPAFPRGGWAPPNYAGSWDCLVHTIHDSHSYHALLGYLNGLVYEKNAWHYWGDWLCCEMNIKLKEVAVITGESVAMVSRDSFGRPKANAWNFDLLLNRDVRIYNIEPLTSYWNFNVVIL